MANWELKNCCKHDQLVFLITLAVCVVVVLALWRTVVLLPFKLVTVFLHEASHAIACKLTCGHVEGMQIHADEGGMTQTRGGVYWFILPAGCNLFSPSQARSTYDWIVAVLFIFCFLVTHIPLHTKFLWFFSCGLTDLGSSFWGMVLILASTNLIAARVAAGCLAAALIIVLFVAKNWTLRWLCAGFIAVLAIVWVLQETTHFRILRYIIMFIGVMNSVFSIYDIYGDLISRQVHTSDAEKFAEVCPCPCTGVGWGVIWGVISLIFLGVATYFGLVILSES